MDYLEVFVSCMLVHTGGVVSLSFCSVINVLY